MAVAVKPSKSLINIRSGIKSVRDSFSNINKKTGNVNNILLKKTKVKRESIARNSILSQRRQEAERRKNREDLIEASSIGGAIKRQGKAVVSSTKGFLGRIMDFLGTLLLGWLAYNLPSIITMAQELIARMQRLATIVSGFFNKTTNIFRGFGNVLGSIGKNILTFDFTDSSGRVKNAMRDLNVNFNDMQSQFDEGFRLLTTSLGEGVASGKDAAPFGTEYPNQSFQQQPSGGGGGGTKYPGLASIVVKGEGGLNSVNRGNAGDTPGGSKSIFGKDLSEMTVGEIMQAQRGGRVFAVGKYQFIPDTLSEAVSYTKIPLNAKFNSATQNRLFDYLIDVKRPEVGAYINGKSNDRRTAVQQLSREFASVGLEYPENGKKRGQSRYAGTGGNRASISPELVGSALDKQRGVGPQKAQSTQRPSAQAPTSKSSEEKSSGALKSVGGGHQLAPGAADSFMKMKSAAASDGVNLTLTSSYRSYAEQAYLYQLYKSGRGNLAAPPGQSKHEKGLAIDVANGIPWMQRNAQRFGWKANVPGEPWHFEYLGGGGINTPAPAQIASQGTQQRKQPPKGTPAQIASQGTQQRQQVSQQLSQQRNGPTIIVMEESQPAQQQSSARGGGGGLIPIVINPLNSFITKKLLLDLAYT